MNDETWITSTHYSELEQDSEHGTSQVTFMIIPSFKPFTIIECGIYLMKLLEHTY